jgi:SAM-dependent methyltransferase
MSSRFGGYEEKEFAELYDPAYGNRRQDVDFFVDYSKRANGRTLELGCGTGRVLIPTAIAGCEITGLDLSPYMLKICREKLDKQQGEVRERVKLFQGDMTGFDTVKHIHWLRYLSGHFNTLSLLRNRRLALSASTGTSLQMDSLFWILFIHIPQDWFTARYIRLKLKTCLKLNYPMVESYDVPAGRQLSTATGSIMNTN